METEGGYLEQCVCSSMCKELRIAPGGKLMTAFVVKCYMRCGVGCARRFPSYNNEADHASLMGCRSEMLRLDSET